MIIIHMIVVMSIVIMDFDGIDFDDDNELMKMMKMEREKNS